MSHSRATQLEQNFNQTFFKPQNLPENFLLKFVCEQMRTSQKFGGNSGPT